MERLLVDTNILIDLLSKREEFFHEAQELFTLADNKEVELFVSSLTFHTALENGIDIIITRNKKDFKNSKLPVMTAKEYLKK